MYDAASLRKQLEQVWANFILEQGKTRRERANLYKTKKIMNQAHGVDAYFDIEFKAEYLALSFWAQPLEEATPFVWMQEAPDLMGVWGAVAESMGAGANIVEDVKPEEEVMDEEDFFAQHFTTSLKDSISGL